MNQQVVVTISAVIAPNFVAAFTESDRAVKALRATVLTLDKALMGLQKRTDTVTKSLDVLSKSSLAFTNANNQSIASTRNTIRATNQALVSNKQLGASYDTLRAQRLALNSTSAVNPRPVTGGVRAGGGGGHGGGVAASAAILGWQGMAMHGSPLDYAGGALTHAGAYLGMSALAVGAGLGVAAHESAEFDTIIRKTAVTAEIGMEQVKGLKDELLDLATNEKTAQGPKALGEALFALVSAGRDLRTQALPSLRTMGMVATAYEADMVDVARTTNTLLDNFLIGPKQMEKAYDIIGKIEKGGRVKMKDMAMVLPEIGGIAHMNKITGTSGLASISAALEVISKQSATPGEAGTRLTDLLGSMTQRYTIEAFNRAGIDLEGRLKSGDAKGQNRLDTLIKVVQEYSHGDAFRIGDLFRNKEAKDALSALIQFHGEYEKMVKEGEEASGYIAKDFESMRGSTENSFRSLTISLVKFALVVGDTVAPAVRVLSRVVEKISSVVVFLNKHFPILTKSVGYAAVAFVVTAGALGTMALAAGLATKAFVNLNMVTIGTGGVFRKLAVLFPSIGMQMTNLAMVTEGGLALTLRATGAGIVEWFSVTAIPAIISGASALGSYLAGAGAVILGVTAPVWAVVAVIVAAVTIVGIYIYKFWQPIKAFFVGIAEGVSSTVKPAWDEFTRALIPLLPIWNEITGALKSGWDMIVELFEPITENSTLCKEWAEAGRDVGTVIGTVLVAAIKLVTATLKTGIYMVKSFIAALNLIPGVHIKAPSNGGLGEDKGDDYKKFNASKDILKKRGAYTDELSGGEVDINKTRTALKKGAIKPEQIQDMIDTNDSMGNQGFKPKFKAQLQDLIGDQNKAKDVGGATYTSENQVSIYTGSNASAQDIGDAVKYALDERDAEQGRQIREGVHN